MMPTVGPSSADCTSSVRVLRSVLDPALWGFGKRLCTQLVVREAADRLTTLTATHRRAHRSTKPTMPASHLGRRLGNSRSRPQGA